VDALDEDRGKRRGGEDRHGLGRRPAPEGQEVAPAGVNGGAQAPRERRQGHDAARDEAAHEAAQEARTAREEDRGQHAHHEAERDHQEDGHVLEAAAPAQPVQHEAAHLGRGEEEHLAQQAAQEHEGEDGHASRQRGRQRRQDGEARHHRGLEEVARDGGGHQRREGQRKMEQARYVVALGESDARHQRREHPREADGGGDQAQQRHHQFRVVGGGGLHAAEHDDRADEGRQHQAGQEQEQAHRALARARHRPQLHSPAREDEGDQPIHDRSSRRTSAATSLRKTSSSVAS